MTSGHALRQVFLVMGMAALLALGSAGPLGAQTVNNAFGDLSENSNDPIDIESDVLTVYDAKKIASFQGNVKVVQGTTTLRAAELDVYYVGGTEKFTGQEAAPAADKASKPDKKKDPQGQINKIEAKGSVVITTSDEQTTTSDWATYDVPAQLVTVGGNVVLSQGQNVLKGDRLIIDLKTGESRFENTGTSADGGRIRALFMPNEEGGGSATERVGVEPKKNSENGAPAGAAPAQDKQTPTEPLPIMPEFR